MSTSTPSRKQEPPIDPQLTRPHLPHTTSQTSESSLQASPKVESTGSSGGLSLSTRNRMPYFRYFGPTAIVPGLRQMVVKVRGKQHGSAQTTSDRKYIPRATDFKLVMRLSRSTCALVAHTLSCCSAVFPSHVADWSRTRNRVLACTAISWLTTSARSPHASRDTRIRCLVNVTKSADHPSL